MLRPRAFSAARGSLSPTVVVPIVARPCGCSHGGLAESVVQQQPRASGAALRPQQRLVAARAKKQKEAKQREAPASSTASSSGDEDLDAVALVVESDAEARMKKALGVVAENFNTMRTGRANPAILDKIVVDYYGVPTPLKSLAAVSVPDASTLIVSPFDRSALRDVEKAILESDVGINPSNDGERIRLNIPPMTQDRRKELAKKVSKMGEDGKVAVRNVRKDAMKRLDKHDWPKDSRKSLEDKIQKITDRFVKSVDDLVKSKTDDLMKV